MSGEIGLAEKIAFLHRADAYPHRLRTVICRETHMSFVFIAGDMVYKLKKPVRFSYLDFSTVERRESACRAELAVNRRLAPGIYVDVVPITSTGRNLAIGGRGPVVDWLVVMHRLAEEFMLDRALADGAVGVRDIDHLGALLAEFYRNARPIVTGPEAHLAEWRRRLGENRRVLFDSRFGLPAGPLMTIDRVQRRFVAEPESGLAERARLRRIVDGHGDLRPEHIWLGEPMAIIDRLEFNALLRECDPFDEIAALDVECEQLGFALVGDRLRRRLELGLRDRVSPTLYAFYRCYHATLRARLTIAHLLDPNCRTPEKWLPLTRSYLAIAARDARRIETAMAQPGKRRAFAARVVTIPLI